MRFVASLLVLIAAIVGRTGAGTAQEVVFERRAFLDGRVTVELPTLLRPMTDAERLAKYARGNAPPIAYADASGDISFALNWSVHRMAREETATRTRQLREQFPSGVVKVWHRTNTETIGGRPAGILDFESEEPPLRNKMMLIELEGRILLLTLNMTKAHEARWAPIADRVLRSLRFRP